MAVPSSITDLSSTAASNSPGGSEIIGGNLDNYLRAAFAILRQQSLAETWVPYGEAVTYVSATTFTVVEATAGGPRWYMGRPIKATVTGGTAYGVIASTSVSGGTRTVTVVTDTPLDSGLSRIDLGVERRSIAQSRNYIINPMFRFWQRNTTFSVAAGAGATKVCDGWLCTAGATSGATLSRQAHTIGQSEVPFEPQFFMRWAVTADAASTQILKHHIEDVRTLAGRTVTLALLCKLSTAGTLTNLSVAAMQNFGSGGSPSADAGPSAQTFTPTSGWRVWPFTFEMPSISGKSLGTVADTHSSYITITSNANEGFTLDVAGVWLVEGSEPILTPQPAFDVGYAEVQRRFYKTFTVDQVPAQNVGNSNSAATYSCIKAGVNTVRIVHPLPVPLRSEVRANQTYTFYSPSASSSNWYNVTGAAASGTSGANSGAIGRNFIVILNQQVLADAIADQISVHFTVDCEYAS